VKTIKRIGKWLLIVIGSTFILLSVLPYLIQDNLSEAPIKPFPNSEYFNFNNTKFHFRLFIPKQIKHKVAFIHGLNGSTFSFRNNIDSLLSINALVLLIDMPAFGYSDKAEQANYSDTNKLQAIHFLLNKVDALTNQNGWELIGHSMGGSVIAQLASAYPKQTRSLVFIDGIPFMTHHSFFQKILLYPPLLKWADIIVSKISFKKNTVKKLLSSAYHKEADDESAEGYLKTFKIKNSGSSIFRMFADIGHSEINDSIINSLPKLIIWGKQDNWIPIQVGSKYFNKPRTRTLLIENAGHCPMETHCNEVNHAITNFISKLD
jgi:pimeloyl-ACP methyl ester carboxylesterase